MAKEERNYYPEFKKLNIFMYIIMTMLLVICILCFVNACGKKEIDYDVSMMREVGVEEALALFHSSDTYVLYIGKESCNVCYDLLPALQNGQKNNNYITQYMDLTKVDRNTDNWKKLVELLNVETTQTLSANGEGDPVTETFGYFLNAKGFTPCVVIIKDGRQVAGFFGSKEEKTFEDWLANYGI